MKNIRNHPLFRLTLCVLFLAVIACFYRCPFRLLTGIDCPGCGLSRAFLAAARLDFSEAFAFHPLFPLIGAEIIYAVTVICFGERIRRAKKLELAIGIATIALLLIVWLIR